MKGPFCAVTTSSAKGYNFMSRQAATLRKGPKSYCSSKPQGLVCFSKIVDCIRRQMDRTDRIKQCGIECGEGGV